TRPWLDYLEQSQGADPVVAAVLDDDAPVGWFTGAIVRRAGVRILGSPFPGWTTSWMGFNLSPGVDRWQACEALAPFAFRHLRCLHVEVRDRELEVPSSASRGWSWTEPDTYQVDLSGTEEDVLARMWSISRRQIRKSERLGVIVEQGRG